MVDLPEDGSFFYAALFHAVLTVAVVDVAPKWEIKIFLLFNVFNDTMHISGKCGF